MYSAIESKISIELVEDTLTSSVFDLLFLLPVETFWLIIKRSSYNENLPIACGEIEEISFWPHWSGQNTGNSRFVEPDIFVKFEEFDLIVEAKRYDDLQQYRSQWEKEAQGYFNEYSEDERTVFLLAIGGLSDTNTEEITLRNNRDVTIIKCRWGRILKTILSMNDRLQQIEISSAIGSTVRIFELIIKAFSLHGYNPVRWPQEANYQLFNIAYDITCDTLANWSAT